MKKIFTLLLVVVAVIFIQACSNKPILKVFLPNDYWNKDVIRDFEKEYNVRVRIINFDSNEVALTQIKANRYDVVVPSDYALEELISENLLEDLSETVWAGLDIELTAELALLLDSFKEDGFDFLKYAAPYFWGTIGVLYNHNITGLTNRVENEGFGIIGDQSLETIIYDSSRDAFLAALLVNDVLLKDATQDDIDDAKDWLIAAKGPKTSIKSDEILTEMLRGTKYDAVIAYNGDAAYIMSENDNYSYFIPDKSNLWADGFAVPKNAENKELAYTFIKFMMTYDAALGSTEYVGYTSPRQDVFDDMIGEDGDYNEPRLRYAYESEVTNFQAFRFMPSLKSMIDDAWRVVIATN